MGYYLDYANLNNEDIEQFSANNAVSSRVQPMEIITLLKCIKVITNFIWLKPTARDIMPVPLSYTKQADCMPF